jgi:hypothetical protein
MCAAHGVSRLKANRVDEIDRRIYAIATKSQ